MYKMVDTLRFKPSLWEFQTNSAPNLVKVPDPNLAVAGSNPCATYNFVWFIYMLVY
jgi:hypothetical protein